MWACLQNKGRTEQSQRRASRLSGRPIPCQRQEAGGGERGKLGPGDGTPYQTTNRLPVSNQRLPEILDGWHLLGGSRLEASSWEQAQGAGTRLARGGNWGWDRGGEKVHRTREECACQAPGCLSCLGGEGTKRRPNRVHAFVEYPKTGTASNAGPAPYRAAGSLSSVDGESTHPWAGTNPVWPEHCECSPHRPATFVCSAPPSLQHEWTSEPKKETTSARLCQGRN